MQARRLKTSRDPKRRGFTLIELLVVISIVATLMALLLPAIQNAREAARRTECLNNQRNLALAMTNWSTAHANQLPAYGYFISDGGGPAVNVPQRSWVVELLPYLDQQGLFDRWDNTLTLAANDAAIGSFGFGVLTCPDDSSAVDQAGGLSYVVNAGFAEDVGAGVDHNYYIEDLDWDADTVSPEPPASDGTEDADITKATGVFWADYEVAHATNPTFSLPNNPSANLGRIYDGLGNTIMIGENLNAGTDPVNATIGNVWASPEHRNCTFIAPVELGTSTPSLVYDSASTTLDYKILPAEVLLAFPNGGKASTEGDTPYLSSLHPGIVVVGFCDGSVRTLSDSIDESVYLRLMTPGGTRLRTLPGPVTFGAETPLSDTDF